MRADEGKVMLDELRGKARDLLLLVSSGDGEAVDRVLRTHPKYAGRPPERLRADNLKLRDAQEVVAREHGFEGWDAAVASERGARPLWDTRAQMRQEFRALQFASRSGSEHARLEHVLDAIASPASPTVAADVLRRLGYEPVVADQAAPPRGTSSTPPHQALVAFAAGLALGLGGGTVADEHVLLAFAYTEAGISLLRSRASPQVST